MLRKCREDESPIARHGPGMSDGETRELLLEAASRAVRYLEALPQREVGAQPGAVERLVKALDVPLPDQPSLPGEILAFLDAQGSPATVASAGGR
ncbi:MAG: hypothetical protein ACTHL7_09515, partial [Steroidobacteraceae bacterium]